MVADRISQGGSGSPRRSPRACGRAKGIALAGVWLTMPVLLGLAACDDPVDPPPPPPPPVMSKTIRVTDTADSGPGTLRQALLDAQRGDTILFDASIFPPDDPRPIAVLDALPQIVQGNLTIDASDAGVILDGSRLLADSWIPGLEVLGEGNTIRGLQVVNFTGTGIVVAEGHNNIIGGDRSAGQGPVGQGNLTSGNDFGIGVWNRATGNVVTGNLVGTDVHGAPGLGNAHAGVWVTEGATDNQIGPDNVIARSGRCGIEVVGPLSLRNTITRNSFQSSGHAGICLVTGGNSAVPVPLVTDLDAPAGRVGGIAWCAGCTVEIFSDEGGEAAVYEGEVRADDQGAFSFQKASGLAHPNVLVTATHADGNTSAFSRPFDAMAGVLTLQEGNSHPRSALVAKPSGELRDNRIGGYFYRSGLWHDIVNGFHSTRDEILHRGVKRLQTSLNEAEPPIDWSLPEFEVPPQYDRLIDEMVAHGVVVDYMLHFWEKDGQGENLSTPRFQDTEQVEAFLEYVRFTVRHFKGRVASYTIWSEPDYCGQGGIKCIEADDYIELVRQVVPVIRAEDPEANVGVAPVVLFFARDYLLTVLRAGVADLFDVIHWHGQINVAPDDAFYGSYYYDYPLIVEEIKQTASEHGFRGEYWSDSMGWCSADQVPDCQVSDQPWGIIETDKLAAKYYARATMQHLGMAVGAGVGGQPGDWLGPWSDPTRRYLATIMAGATAASLPVNVDGAATVAHLRSFGFGLPDGDRLFAIWTDGTAVEQDPGVEVTLTFPDMSGEQVFALDVLHGFEQQLITDVTTGDLRIRDLLVKDYPLILRLER